jgi:hypothetical protein
MLIVHSSTTPLCLRPLLLITLRLGNVKTQTVRVQVDLVARVLQNLGNIPGVLKLSEINVRAALLDGVTNQLGRAGLTLRADDGGLLLLAGLVDDEGGALGFLLGDLLGFNGSGKFGGEGEVLGYVSKKLQKEWNSAYSQRNVIKHDVESRRSPHKVVAHES